MKTHKNLIPKNSVIAIAGTVGVGKSTFTEILAEKLNFKTSFESVDNNPYLDLYYNDKARWGFHLQVFFLAERFKIAKKMFQYGGGFIQDRTIYEDMEIFAKMNFDHGSMSEEDYSTYKSLFEAMVLSPFFAPPTLIIYLEGDINQIMERVEKRGRISEINTDLAYWTELHERYDNWIESFNSTKILRLNINEFDCFNEDHIDEVILKINNILQP